MKRGFVSQLAQEYGRVFEEENTATQPRFCTRVLSLSSKPLRPEKYTLTCGAISGGVGVFGFTNGTLLRWNAATGTSEKLTISAGALGRPETAGSGGSVPFSALSSATAAITATGLSRTTTKVSGKPEIRWIFLSPQGLHGIIGLSNGVNCYTQLQTPSCRPIPSLKDHVLQCVCWSTCGRSSSSSTIELLIGGKERVVRPVYSLSQKAPIVRILVTELPQNTMETKPSSSDGAVLRSPLRFSIIVATPCQLFQFTGGPTLEAAFQSRPAVSSSSSPPPEPVRQVSSTSTTSAGTAPTGPGALLMGLGAFNQQQHFDELVAARLPPSNLILECPGDQLIGEVHVTNRDRLTQLSAIQHSDDKVKLWWLTGTAVVATSIHLNPPPDSSLVVHTDATVIPFPTSAEIRRVMTTECPSLKAPQFHVRLSSKRHASETAQQLKFPMSKGVRCRSIALTPSYLLMLLDTRLAVFSRVSQRLVETLSLAPVRYGTSRCLITDTETGAIYLLTDKFLFEVASQYEQATAWFQFALANDFLGASRAATSPTMRDILLSYHAKTLYTTGNYIGASSTLGSCHSIPLEDIVLFTLCHGSQEATALNAALSASVSQFTAVTLQAAKTALSRAKHGNDGRHPITNGIQGGALVRPGLLKAYAGCLNVWLLEDGMCQLNTLELHIEQLKYSRTFSTMTRYDTERTDVLKQCVQRRKQLLTRLQRVMQMFADNEKFGSAVDELCESFGRYQETLFWAELIRDQERPLLEALGLGNSEAALACIEREPPKLQTSYEDLQRTKQSNQYLSWRENQLRLLVTYGPQLFLQQPVRLAQLLVCNIQDRQLDTSGTQGEPSTSSPTGLQALLEQAWAGSGAMSGSIEMLLPIVTGTIAQWQSEDTAFYTDLHRCEALKILEWALHITAKQTERLAACPGTWLGRRGLWNMTTTLLASCTGMESELIKKLSVSNEFVTQWDVQGLLRLCAAKGKHRAIVTLLTLQGSFEQAVKVALWAKDFEMAKFAARRAPSDPCSYQLRQKLWKKIAAAAVDVLSTPDLLILLEESDGTLKLHEILEYVSTASVVGAFRDDFCKAFDACERRVREKQEDTAYNLQTLTSLKKRLKQQQSRVLKQIDENSLCLLCRQPLLVDRFYVFPCRHAIHALCSHHLLVNDPEWKWKDRYRCALMELAQALTSVPPMDGSPEQENVVSAKLLETVQKREEDVDAYLADDCPLCGKRSISVIGVPFLTPAELAGVDSPWTIESVAHCDAQGLNG